MGGGCLGNIDTAATLGPTIPFRTRTLLHRDLLGLPPLHIVLMSKSLDPLFEVVEELLVPLRMPYLSYLENVVVQQLVLDILALVVEHSGEIIHECLRGANVVTPIYD